METGRMTSGMNEIFISFFNCFLLLLHRLYSWNLLFLVVSSEQFPSCWFMLSELVQEVKGNTKVNAPVQYKYCFLLFTVRVKSHAVWPWGDHLT